MPLPREWLSYFCPCLLSLVGASWPVNTCLLASQSVALWSRLATDRPALLVCHSVKQGKAQEPETTKSGLGDVDENVAGDNA